METLIASDRAADDPDLKWTQWLASLSEPMKRILATSDAEGERTYREMYLNGRISLSAILLELFTIEAAT
jgi:hypothetical protein